MQYKLWGKELVDGRANPYRRAKPSHRSIDSDELRPVTALFADVVGSTALGERLAPAEVKAVIGECVTRMCETVESYGGRVTGQMGDGIAAFFGLHVAHEDDAVRAARAALEIRSVVAAYAHEVREAWQVDQLNVRIGLNEGRVAAGPVGGRDETVIALGDAVNVAARLQAAAAPGGIIVGASVAEMLAGRFALAEVGHLTVKGREEPVDAFELLTASERPRKRADSVFVGRLRELDDAETLLDELQTGRGQVVTVVGDGGIGKTRLLEEFRRRARSDIVWLSAVCDPLDIRLPYEPLEQVLRGFLGIDRSASAIELRMRFRTVMQQLLGERFETCAPQLARILGIELEQRLMEQLDGLPHDLLTNGLHSAVAEWLAALAREAPVVLAIDNLHDASEATTDVIGALIERLDRLPILVLLTMRPDIHTSGWRTRVQALANHSHRCQDITLRPLDLCSSRQLVSALDGCFLLNERLREVVVERAEGNPLYIEQLIAAIGTDAEPWIDPVPRALESFLLSRIDSLSPKAKGLLQAAAVLGRVFAEDVLVKIRREDFDLALSELLKADLIKEHQRSPRQFTFRHGLLRDAAISTLTPDRLQKLHRASAEAIEGWHGYDVERDADVLAGHLAACGNSLRSAECLEILGDRLVLVYRRDDAMDAFRRALEMLRVVGAWSAFSLVACKQAQLLGVAGDVVAAIALIDEALVHETTTGHVVDLVMAKAERLADANRLDDVEPLLTRALNETKEEETIGRALVLRGQLALERQSLDEAESAARRLEELTGISKQLAFDRASLRGGIAATNGDFLLAEQYAVEAQAIADELGRIPSQLLARRRVGVMHRLVGSVREGYEMLADVFERYREIGDVVGQLETAVNLLDCAVWCGEFAEGRHIAELGLDVTAETTWRAMLLANLATIEVERGEFSRARDAIDEIDAMHGPLPPWTSTVRTIVEAHLDGAARDWAGAEERVRGLLAGPQLRGREGDIGIVEAFHAEIAEALGWHEEAVRSATCALSKVGAADSCLAVQIERIFGTIIASDDPALAKSKLEAALSAARRSGMRLEEAYCLTGMGVADDSRRAEHFAEARALFERCGSRRGILELDRIRQTLVATSAP